MEEKIQINFGLADEYQNYFTCDFLFFDKDDNDDAAKFRNEFYNYNNYFNENIDI